MFTAFRNRCGLAYTILENGKSFGYAVRDADGVPVIVKGCGSTMDFFSELVNGWEEKCGKLDNQEISRKGYEGWKRTWDNDIWAKTSNGKISYTGK